MPIVLRLFLSSWSLYEHVHDSLSPGVCRRLSLTTFLWLILFLIDDCLVLLLLVLFWFFHDITLNIRWFWACVFRSAIRAKVIELSRHAVCVIRTTTQFDMKVRTEWATGRIDGQHWPQRRSPTVGWTRPTIDHGVLRYFDKTEESSKPSLALEL